MNNHRPSAYRSYTSKVSSRSRSINIRRAILETLEDRRLMTGAPWEATQLTPTWDSDNSSLAPQTLVPEGEGSLVAVSLNVRNVDGSSLNPQQIQLGQAFQLVVSAQDLRPNPMGVFALFNDLQISQANNLELMVGETQLLELSSNVIGGSFQLTTGSTTVTVNIPSGFRGNENGTYAALASSIQSALNGALGANAVAVLDELGASTPRFTINFRGELLGLNAPALTGSFSGLTTSSGSPSGSLTDDFIAANPNDAQAFRYSAVDFFPGGVRPSGRYNSSQPSYIASAGATQGLGLPSNPGAVTPFYAIHFRAVAAGTSVITTSPGQDRPADDILIYPVDVAPPELVDFQSLSVTIGSTTNSVVDLGTLAGSLQLPGQQIATSGSEKLYKFTTTAVGSADNKVLVEFNHAQGDLDIELLNADRQVIGSSLGVTNSEQISLSGREAGTYYLRVFGFQNAINTFNLVISPPVATIAPDQYEENDARASATELGLLEGVHEYSGLTIHNATDSDFFKFSTSGVGRPEDVIRIQFSHARGDLDIRLINADNETIAGGYGTRDVEEISLNGLPAGTYYLQVYGYSGATNPAYSMRLNTPQLTLPADAFEPNNSREQAANLTITGGLTRFDNLTVHSTADQDWYRFNVPVKPSTEHKITVAFAHAVADIDIELYSSTGTLLRRSAGVGDSEEIPLAGLGEGDYFLRVFSFLSVPSPSYSLSLALPSPSIAPDAWESNQTRETASNLRTVDGPLELFNLSLHNSDDVDWFRFQTVGPGTSSHFAGLVFNGALGDVDMALYDAQGVQLAQSSSSSDTELVSLNGLAAGTYFIKVYGYRGATSPRYSLSIQAPELNIAPDQYEPNNEISSPTQLREVTGVRTLTDLSIDKPSDVDWFEFTTVTTSSAQHNVTVDFQDALGDIDIILYSANGDFVASSAGIGDQERVSLANLPAGTYRLLVYAYSDGTNPSYNVTFTTPTLEAASDRLEANDSMATATDLRSVSGEFAFENLSIHSSSDHDWFRLETVGDGNSNHRIDVRFLHTEGDVDVKLYNSAGDMIRSSESVLNEESISLDGLAAGVYLVEVYGYAGATNLDYDIAFHTPESANLLPDRFESNDTLATASLLRTTGDNLVGSLNVGDLTVNSEVDLDYYQFNTVGTGTAAHAVSISYPAGAGDLQLDILDSSGAIVGSSNTGSGSESVSLNGLAAGRYYAKVGGSFINAQNRYSLRLDAPTNTATGDLDAWTIMVYMTASDLANFAFDDINEMEQAVAGLPGSVNIAVLWDQSAAFPAYATDSGEQTAWTTLGRAFIEPDTNPNSIATRFEVLPEASTGDPNTLASFMRWAAANAPAEHYAMIGWDHGSGIYGSNFDSADNTAGDHLKVSEWLSAFSQPDVPSIDLLSFDACLMAMAEVQYTLRDVTTLFVGSQEVVSGAGYDYRTLFQSLVAQPHAVTPEALANGFVQSYQNMTAGPGNWDTQSAVVTDATVNVANALSNFTSATIGLSAPQLSSLARAIEASISYFDPEFRDLGSIMLGVLQNSDLPTGVLDAAQGVLNAISNSLVLKSNDNRQSSGISIFTPESGIVGSYYTSEYADFVSATGWADMLQRIGTISAGRVTSGGRFGAFASTRDWAESNNIAVDATNLHLLSGSGVTLGDLSLHDATDTDWYRFSIGSGATTGHAISLNGHGASLSLMLYDPAGLNLLASSDGTAPLVSLAGLPAGEYSILVSGNTAVRDYSIVTSAPAATSTSRLGDNSTQDKAYPLGLVGNQMTIPSLPIAASGNSWFSLETPRLPQPSWYSVTINSPAGANLVVEVLDESGNVVSRDSGSGTLTVGYRASGSSESYRIHISNAGNTPAVYNLSIDTLVGTITNLTVPERLIGVGIDALPLNELVHQVGQVTVDDPRFEWADGMLRLRAGQVLSRTNEGGIFIPITVADASQPGTSVSFVLPLQIESNPFAFHNAASALNVNNDTNPRTGLPAISALDALLIINDINTRGSRPLTNRNASAANSDPFIDTSRDGFLSAIDALLVINYLNTNPNGEGESIENGATQVVAIDMSPSQPLVPEYIYSVDTEPTGFRNRWAAPQVRSQQQVWDSALADLMNA